MPSPRPPNPSHLNNPNPFTLASAATGSTTLAGTTGTLSTSSAKKKKPPQPTFHFDQPSSHRIYKAPQASIRHGGGGGSITGGGGGASTSSNVSVNRMQGAQTAGSTRRRRRESGVENGLLPASMEAAIPPPPLNGAANHNLDANSNSPNNNTTATTISSNAKNNNNNNNNNSSSNYRWMEISDDAGASEGDSSLHDWRSRKNVPRQRSRRSLTLRQGHEEFSESYDFDDSFLGNTFYPNENYASSYSHHRGNHHHRAVQLRRILFNYQNIVQFLVLVVFVAIIFDAHWRVRKGKVQIEQYDEERAHILEQMMWIDKAAKEVYRKYAQQAVWDNFPNDKLEGESQGELVDVAEGLRDALKRLQLRIQLNARDKIQERFGQRPVHVKLGLDADGAKLLEIALTDDTPHAAVVFLEQIDRKLWYKVQLQKCERTGAIQISTDFPATNPILEFVESSHSCRKIGGVAIRQLEAEQMGLYVTVLRVHMQDDQPLEEEEVCIGKVVAGLEYLQAMNDLPVIHDPKKRLT